MKKLLKIVIQVLIKVSRATPVAFALCAIISVLHGGSYILVTIANQYLLDSAVELINGEKSVGLLLVAVLLFGGSKIVSQVLNGVGNLAPEYYFHNAKERLTIEIHEKISKISAIQFEDTNILDDFNKAEHGKDSAVYLGLIINLLLSFYSVYIVFMGGYLYSLKPELTWAIVMIFIPILFSQIIRIKVFAKLEDASAPLRREQDYYEGCIVNRDLFKETRLLGGFEYFKKLYQETLDTANKLRLKSEMKTVQIEAIMKMLTILGYTGVYIMLFDAVMKQEISIGAFAAVTSSVGMLYGIMSEIVCVHIGRIAQNLGSVENYFNFLNLPEEKGNSATFLRKSGIELKDVSFKYPSNEKWVLKKINFVIQGGETIAVVGENGSGKSTLMRLMSGMYTPIEGVVTYGGESLSEIHPKERYKNLSIVCQKYQRYQLTLKENVTIACKTKAQEVTELEEILANAGVDLANEQFAQGYDTLLSREFGGVDLSGGQWQRIAIARGLYKNHEVIILDEPTAAIDPIEETRLYQKFAQITKEKTAIIVTHRVGSAKIADRIVVMKDGNVVEQGTHEVLLAKNGEYARLYYAQEQWYTEAESS